jgi:hypothetical protein
MIPFMITFDGHDMMLFSTIADVEKYVEPCDINEYQIFDREGFSYLARLEGRRVVISKDENAPQNKVALETGLIHYLLACGESAKELKGLPLESLLQKAARRFLLKN